AECKKHGVLHSPNAVFGYLNEFEDKQFGEQMTLF
ncbi:MAG TPA: radical SAM protein, partial [Ruminiclostridium sp.]|nr:radical SAM protein [Ruminiclostridium sp.]